MTMSCVFLSPVSDLPTAWETLQRFLLNRSVNKKQTHLLDESWCAGRGEGSVWRRSKELQLWKSGEIGQPLGEEANL